MMTGSGMFFGGGYMWLFWGLLIVAVIFLVRYLVGNGGSSAGRSDSPLEILQKRFARGEIDEEEFERRRRELEK